MRRPPDHDPPGLSDDDRVLPHDADSMEDLWRAVYLVLRDSQHA